jgi:hypothetical protein
MPPLLNVAANINSPAGEISGWAYFKIMAEIAYLTYAVFSIGFQPKNRVFPNKKG